MRILGIDYGKSKIGLAIGDTDTKIASPFDIVLNDENFLRYLKDLVSVEKIKKIVIGVPYGVGNTVSAQAKYCLDFAEDLKSEIFIPIETLNEHLTSAHAQSLLQKKNEAEDDVAAMLILQDYLERNPKF